MNYEVIIVGGGPVGMLLAAELALAEVNVCVLERLKETTPYSRALTLHPRSLEILDMRGLKPKLLETGKPISTGHFAALDTRLNFSKLDSSSNYTLFIPQHDTEKVLEDWARELGVGIHRETEVKSISQDEHGVEVTAVGPEGKLVLTADYLVGADGAGSIVRKHAGIPFVGTSETITAILGDVVLTELSEPSIFSQFNEQGQIMVVPLKNGLHRIVAIDPERVHVPKSEPVTLEELRSAMVRMLGSDLGISDPYWLSRYGNATRQAERYREGRIFLAGDAAHIHFPAGGQGLNVGLQEAMNLGWKLAAELKGRAPEWLLNSYQSERFPINTALLRNTEVQTFLMGSAFTSDMINVRCMLSDLLLVPEANYKLASQISAFNIQYASAADDLPHELNGRRLPELKLSSADGALRNTNAYELFRTGSYVLLHFAEDDRIRDVVEAAGAKCICLVCASLELEAPDWSDVHTVLVRPDGYVAWAVSRSESNPMNVIATGISRWCIHPSIR
ncbi:hypothetical protein PVOR_19319 [Paenibacillus vortex V453]|uniref:FAD-binding domain-containing protein n=1 Tax=Paenibacillus vortex V453 TaxID=715225 RepID=A0A2R9SSZ5_9BACL|nr:monooxygenase [Paenibacillus vortex]EFU40462.1 hypothetical protein PVOR_19319 [Paenibacillus vortex V453]